MNHNNVVSVFLVLGWICLIGECGVLRSHIPGGYKNSQLKGSVSELDCSQFIDDYDIIRQFPFPVLINPSEYTFEQSIVTMNKNNTFVQDIYIIEEEVVPSSVFCLSNLQILSILETPFQDGIVPDALANLKQLQEIFVYSSPIVKITELLVTLTNISILVFDNCSLTHIQNLDKLDNLWSLELRNNRLSHIDGIPAVAMLRLGGNLFTEIPTTKDKDKLKYLVMDNNPLTNAMPILSYKNLQQIDLENTTLTSIPAEIDKLEKLDYLHLANNKISHFPTSIFNLQHLEDFTFRNNLLSPDEIKSIREAFKKSHPNTYVSI